MEQDECKKLLPLVNPKLYKSTMNKERQKQREEEKAEKEQQDSPSLATVESPIEVKAKPVINEILTYFDHLLLSVLEVEDS